MNKQIVWNLVNSFLAGGIFFAGSFTATQTITLNGLLIAAIIALGVSLANFREYWQSEKKNKNIYTIKFL